MMTISKKSLIGVAKETDKPESNSELIKRTEIENSPFVVITSEGKSFGTLGKYRITEVYNDIEECIDEVKKITWNRIIQVFMLLNEEFSNVPSKKNLKAKI